MAKTGLEGPTMKPMHHAQSLLFLRPITLLMGYVPIGAIIDYFMRSAPAIAGAAVQHDPAIASKQLALYDQVAHT